MENAIATKKSEEKLAQIRQRAIDILSSTSSDFKLPYLIDSARQEIASGLIMKGKGLKIYKLHDGTFQLWCQDGYYFKNSTIQNEPIEKMISEITKTIQQYPNAVFSESEFRAALEGKNPAIVAFQKAMRENSKLIESVEKICNQMKKCISQLSGLDCFPEAAASPTDLEFHTRQITKELNEGLKMVHGGIRIWVREMKISQIDLLRPQNNQCWLREECSIPLYRQTFDPFFGDTHFKCRPELAEKVQNIIQHMVLRNKIDTKTITFDKVRFDEAMLGGDPAIATFHKLVEDFPILFA